MRGTQRHFGRADVCFAGGTCPFAKTWSLPHRSRCCSPLRSGHTWVIRSPYSCCLRGCCTVLGCGGFRTSTSGRFWPSPLGCFVKWKAASAGGLLCGFYGLIFGTLTAIPVLILSGPAATLAYIISGIPFDLVHGVSNFLLAFLLLPTPSHLARLDEIAEHGTHCI